MSESSAPILPGTLEVEQPTPGVTLIRLLGEHDLSTVEKLRDSIARSTDAAKGLVVSLADAEFIDSSVLNSLVVGDSKLREKGRRLVLHFATASIVRRVLEISGLSEHLPATTSLEVAVQLASVQEGASVWSGA